MIKCNGNCLECPYPEMPPECEEMAATEEELSEIESRKPDKDDIQREKQRQRVRNYYREHREEKNAYTRRWRKQHRERTREHQRAQRERNIRRYGREQRPIKQVRCESGLKAWKVAEMVGVAVSTYRKYESGAIRAPWDKLCKALPELERYRPREGAE